jgi:hypothetical protein
MNVPTSINGRRFQASSIVGQPFSSVCAAELSKDGEIFNSGADDDNNDDDNFLFVRQILASLKRAIKIIDLTYDDNNDNKSDDGNYTEVNCLRYTRTT